LIDRASELDRTRGLTYSRFPTKQRRRNAGNNDEEEKEARKVAPWWRYAEDFFRQVYATDLARIAPATPWYLDPAYTTVSVGPRYEVGEDKIGIPIPGLNYDRKARGSQASTSTPAKLQTSPIKDLKEEVKGVKPVVGTIPAVPSEPFVMPPLKEYEEGIELVQRLSSVEVARIVGNIIDLDENSA
jgi:hypothetical protein